MSADFQNSTHNNLTKEISDPLGPPSDEPKNLKRIDGKFILSEIGSVLNFQKGIFFTIKELILRPGSNVRTYLQKDRKRLVKPISFIILCSLIYIILQKSFQFEDGYINYTDLDWKSEVINSWMLWVSNNYGFTNLFMAFFTAFWIKVFFNESEYNIFEILVLLFFLVGIQMLMLAFFGVTEALSGLKIMDAGVLISIIYIGWAISHFFEGNKKANFVKGIVAYILGLTSLIIAMLIFGRIIGGLLSLF